jgi:hypothetical protein
MAARAGGQEAPRVIAEGRLAAPLPGGLPGQVYERRCLKRTLGVDAPVSAWATLLSGAPGAPLRNIAVHWDEHFLYLAARTAGVTEARFDIDGAGDGWARGADNLSVRLSPPPGAGTVPVVEVRRFDSVQNREKSVWAASPLPLSAVRAAFVRLPDGDGWLSVALPRTELFGLRRKNGAEWGLRAAAGTGEAQAADARGTAATNFLHLILADRVDASGRDVLVKLGTPGGARLLDGQTLNVSMELRNAGREPVTVRRVFLQRLFLSDDARDGLEEREVTLAPGQRIRRELRAEVRALPLPQSLGEDAFLLAGGVELASGERIIARASYDVVAPFVVTLTVDDRPVDRAEPDRSRLAVVGIQARADLRRTAAVRLVLPSGWTVESGEPEKSVALAYASEVKGASFKVVPPPQTAPGDYALTAQVVIAGRIYRATATIRVL